MVIINTILLAKEKVLEQKTLDVVKSLNKALAPMDTNIKFGVDKDDIFHVSVIEAESKNDKAFSDRAGH